MDVTSTSIHFHGTSVKPVCTQDEVPFHALDLSWLFVKSPKYSSPDVH